MLYLLEVCAYSPSILKVPSPGSYHELEEGFKLMYHSHNVTHPHPYLAEPEPRLISTLCLLKRSAFSLHPNLFPWLLHYEGGFAITIVNCAVMPQGSKCSLSLSMCQTEHIILNVSEALM